MSSTIFFFLFIIILAIILFSLNLLLAPHNPYSDKTNVYECGFDSFLHQNRQEFSISFFIFSLLFLIFDLEIVLIYPYVVSAYNNSIYGLAIVLIFLIILTAGFVFEIGKGALKISSRQSHNLNNIYLSPAPSPSVSSLASSKGLNKKFNLNQHGRFYSTKIPKYKEAEFWRKANSTNYLDNENPFIIVNNILKENPKLVSDTKLAKDLLNINLLHSILSRHIKNFYITEEEFEILRNIKPNRLELPVKYKDDLVKLVGKYTRKGENGVPGAYAFTNRKNNWCYVGSSISLSNRLSSGYLGLKPGNSKIGLAIKEAGIISFYLDIYLLPEKLVNEKYGISRIRDFSLALEQYLILLHNPIYNVLKVVGSPAGIKRSPKSMLPSLLKNSKPLYLYDENTKQLICVSASQTEMGKSIGTHASNLGSYVNKNILYLNRLRFSNTPLDSDKYSENLLDIETLKELVGGISKEYRLYLNQQNLSKTKRKVKLTNINTNEVLIFDSRGETARYLQTLNSDFKCSAGHVSDSIKKGRIYKGIFKFEKIS